MRLIFGEHEGGPEPLQRVSKDPGPLLVCFVFGDELL